jgi:Leucine-rich repeat (LRR) protein
MHSTPQTIKDKIEEAKRGKTKLRLGNMQLTEIPQEVFELSHLTALSLTLNPNLRRIPPEIGKLTSLTILKLSGCPIMEIPKEIGLLTKF